MRQAACVLGWLMIVTLAVATACTKQETAVKKKPSKRVSKEVAEQPATPKEAAREPKAKQAPPAKKKATPKKAPPPAEPPKVEPTPPPEMPKVTLSDKVRATCRLTVGDPMPDGELTDLEGKAVPVASLRGEKLTAILLFTSESSDAGRTVAAAALSDLARDVVSPFGEKGVKAVGIDVKDSSEVAKQIAEKAGVKFPVLIDAEGQFFGKLATEKLPRIYLLDASGKILWFDVEFSRSTRRDLTRAIQAVLTTK